MLFILLFLALAAFHVYAHLFGIEDGSVWHEPGWLLCFAVLFGLASVLVMFVRWKRLDQRRLDYRALAEALRVRLAWAEAGIGRSVADSYLEQLRSEMSWARRALQHVSPPPGLWAHAFSALRRHEQINRLHGRAGTWVEGQVKFFGKGKEQHQRAASRLNLIGVTLAIVGVVLVSCLLFLDVGEVAASSSTNTTESARDAAPAEHPPPWLLVMSGTLLVGGGLVVAYGEHRSYRELAKQYERMHVVFRRGMIQLSEHLKPPEDVARAQTVIEALGREAITEHAQWLNLRRARPFELHLG